MPEKRSMIYLCRVFKHCFFFQPSTKLFEILVKTPVLFWSVGMIKQLSSSMPLKKGNSNRFLSYMDGRFRQQLTIIDVSMSVALLIISTYFQKTLFRQRWCLQVFGLCDRITWKQINWKTKKWLVVDTRLKCCQLIFLQCFFFVWNITIGYLWAS